MVLKCEPIVGSCQMLEFITNTFHYRNSFLQCILNEGREQFSHSNGILPLRIDKRFAKMLIPTFFSFDFNIIKLFCLEVKFWLKFKIDHCIFCCVVNFIKLNCMLVQHYGIGHSPVVHFVNVFKRYHVIRIIHTCSNSASRDADKFLF